MTVTFSWDLDPAATPTEWSTIEDLIRSWVLRASGLAEGLVYFAHQQVKISETSPRVTIDVGDLIPAGVDELAHDFDDTRPAGNEIEYSSKGRRTLVVTLQAFAPRTVGAGVTARSVLTQCQARLRLPSYRDVLNAGGLGVHDEGTVQRLPQVVAGQWEDGAILEVRFGLTVTATENTGYIETVEVTPELEE